MTAPLATTSSATAPLATGPGDAADAPRGRIVFVVTEDWFFASHFLPLLDASKSAGLEAVVVARVREHRSILEAAGARVIALDVERRDMRPGAIGSAIRQLSRILKRERPAIVHCISLRSIAVGGLAARIAGVPRTVFALTGLGLMGARTDGAARVFRRAARLALRHGLATGRTRFVLENKADAEFLGLAAGSPRITLLGGAGVDPHAYPVTPLPPIPPLRLALVARMLWSKGVDTAVEAVCLARSLGSDATLSIYGAPDASNPRAIPEETLRAWSARDGIEWMGRTEDVAAVWAGHHAALMPSRGGEGLPRSILEAASSGRCVLTSDVPGCRDFVRDGIDGFVTPPGDARALAASILRLSQAGADLSEMGRSARERVLAGHRSSDVSAAVAALYRDMIDRSTDDRTPPPP